MASSTFIAYNECAIVKNLCKNKVSVIGLSDGQGIERENCFSCPKDLCDTGTLLKGEFCIFKSKK